MEPKNKQPDALPDLVAELQKAIETEEEVQGNSEESALNKALESNQILQRLEALEKGVKKGVKKGAKKAAPPESEEETEEEPEEEEEEEKEEPMQMGKALSDLDREEDALEKAMASHDLDVSDYLGSIYDLHKSFFSHTATQLPRIDKRIRALEKSVQALLSAQESTNTVMLKSMTKLVKGLLSGKTQGVAPGEPASPRGYTPQQFQYQQFGYDPNMMQYFPQQNIVDPAQQIQDPQLLGKGVAVNQPLIPRHPGNVAQDDKNLLAKALTAGWINDFDSAHYKRKGYLPNGQTLRQLFDSKSQEAQQNAVLQQ